jgi:hypothetical protein
VATLEILIGHYGSGKTEIALNRALSCAAAGEKVTLVDLDIVNPYFRSGEQRSLLESNGITVIRPVFEGTNLDIPSLPAEVQGVFTGIAGRVLIDVGGDPAGAAVLGRYATFFRGANHQVLVVCNTCRPWSTSVEEICWMTKEIAQRARMPLTGFIHNTNLAWASEPESFIRGDTLLRKAGEEMRLPVLRSYALPQVIAALPSDFKERLGDTLLPLTLYMRPEWLDEDSHA